MDKTSQHLDRLNASLKNIGKDFAIALDAVKSFIKDTKKKAKAKEKVKPIIKNGDTGFLGNGHDVILALVTGKKVEFFNIDKNKKVNGDPSKFKVVKNALSKKKIKTKAVKPKAKKKTRPKIKINKKTLDLSNVKKKIIKNQTKVKNKTKETGDTELAPLFNDPRVQSEASLTSESV